jgi:methylisocitrate lyase
MTRAEEARRAFRQLLAEDGIVVQPAIADPLAARIAEQVGFRAIALGGFALGAELATSEPLLSLADVAGVARYITMACRLPLMVDAGAGWGEPLHVAHTVRVLEHAGVASVHIEDQAFPKRAHYHRGIEHVIPAEDMCAKIRAAVAARTDPNVVIVARSDAMLTHGYDEGIRRARMYAAAGADMVKLFPNNADEARRTPPDLAGIPLVYVNSEGNRLGRAVLDVRTLDEWGWKLVYDAISVVNVVGSSVRDVLAHLHRTGRTGLDHDEMIAARQYVEDTIGLPDLYRLEEETVEPPADEGADGR